MENQNNTRLTARVGYQPQWRWSFLLPQYWGVWLGVFCLLILGLIPFRLRDKFAAKLGVIIGNKAKKQRRRARVNLQQCFPEWSEQQREEVIDKMFIVVTQVMLGIGESAIFSKAHLRNRCELRGWENIQQARDAGKNIILMVPHGWAIDTAGILLRCFGLQGTAMYNPHRNPLVDWLWTGVRSRFGTMPHARQNGIKPFLKEVRNGEAGYYLPDEDHGEELSVYVDFFATYKATLPGLNKMAKFAKAVVIPMFPSYDAEKGKYIVDIRPALELTDEPEQAARAMNKIIEDFVTPNPEQYVWILRLLKTRKDGEDIYR